jgi:MoaA/NifB/PqqE/SkfB family radical SAM enzyme
MSKTKVSYPWENNYAVDLLKRFIFTRYFSRRKFYNLMLGLAQNFLLPDRAVARPSKMIIEPSDRCNLSCPLCPTGRRLAGRKETDLCLETFKKAIDPLVPFLYEVYLYNWGEPLLNPGLFDMVRYCSARRIRTVVSTNLTLFENRMMDPLMDSGLDTLIVSLDGASAGSYSQYRRGGDFGKVLGNLKAIAAEKTKRGAKFPRLIWQFIVFRHNEAEIPQAVATAKQLGLDEIKFIASFAKMESLAYNAADKKREELEDYLPRDHRYHLYGSNKGAFRKVVSCPFLWNQIAVRSDGGIAPCCGSYHRKDDFGSLSSSDIMSVWNNERYQRARKSLRTRGWFKSHTICDQCIINDPYR